MAENFTYKRQTLALEAIAKAADIINGVNRLNEIKAEVAESGGGFADDDFSATPAVSYQTSPYALAHLNAWKMNNLVNQVAPGLIAALDSTLEGSFVTYEMILLAVKK